MRGWIKVALIAGVVVLLVCIFVVWVKRSREAADRAGCLNNFRLLGQFAATYAKPPQGKTRAELNLAVPAGTVANPALPFDSQLSWIAGNLATLSPRDAELAKKIDLSAAWDAESNRGVSGTPLALFTCPGHAPTISVGNPAFTQYVGIGGVGLDAATLDLGPPIPNRAGCFRYDAPTPLQLIADNDGLSQTAMFAEVANDLGPWIRGGPSSVRCANTNDANWRTTQFAGNFPEVSGFGFADGSAKFITMTANPQVLLSMFTIAGKGFDPIVGE
jgi:hypothetical protein